MESVERTEWEVRSKWNDLYMLQATKLTFLGLSEQQIADLWGIALVTLAKWKNTKPGFYEALNNGKQGALSEVAISLYKAAVGYEYDDVAVTSYQGEVTITPIKKYKGPNPWAAAKILALKDPAWREVQKTESIHTNINIAKLDLTAMSSEELALFESIQKKQLTEHVGNS